MCKNTCELDIVLSRTVHILSTNALIKLTMPWTTGPLVLIFLVELIIMQYYHITIIIRKSLSQYYFRQGSNIKLHHHNITISESHSILINFADFIKTRIPVKIPNITAFSNITFATILTNIFGKQKYFCSHTFINLDRKKLQNVFLTEREKSTGTKTTKLSMVEEPIDDSYQ